MASHQIHTEGHFKIRCYFTRGVAADSVFRSSQLAMMQQQQSFVQFVIPTRTVDRFDANKQNEKATSSGSRSGVKIFNLHVRRYIKRELRPFNGKSGVTGSFQSDMSYWYSEISIWTGVLCRSKRAAERYHLPHRYR
jgi:hypothetical protein